MNDLQCSCCIACAADVKVRGAHDHGTRFRANCQAFQDLRRGYHFRNNIMENADFDAKPFRETCSDVSWRLFQVPKRKLWVTV